MADPLSIALAAITLATALKDIIELAQKVNDSFKKPARNMQKAEFLAAETLGIVQDLKRFYDGHEEILGNAPDMRDAVLRLSKETEMIYEECKPMLQLHDASNGTVRTWIKRKLRPWWKRNTVEESIQNLRDGANKCRGDFMTFALLRIEAATAQAQATTAHVQATTAQTQATAVRIEATAIEIRAAVTHGLARPHIQPLHPQVTDGSLLAFLGSTPVILSQLPPHVKLAEHLVYKEAITFQVGEIEILCKMITSGEFYPKEEPDHLYLQPFNAPVCLKPSTKEEIKDFQFDVFAQIARIRENLKGRHNGLSIQNGVKAMSRLSVWLSNIEMRHESSAMLRFAVDIYRILSKTNEDVYGPHLAHALYLMSCRLLDTRELVQAYKVVTGAVTLGRRLVAASPTFEIQIQLANLVRYSASVARLNRDLENATRDAEEAVQIYERLIENSTSASQMEVNIIEKMHGPPVMTLKATRVYNFALALEELHYSLSSIKRRDGSVSAGIKALELYSALEQRGNHTYFSISIANLCCSLASDDNQDVISVEQALSYAQKAVSQYEKILQQTGNIPRDLPVSLARQGKILSDLGRVEEAHIVFQKLKRVVQNYVEDNQLHAESLLQLTENLRHYGRLEAALVGEQIIATCRVLLPDRNLCDVYADTSRAFEESGNTLKAVQIAESAVRHYRILAFHDSKNVNFLSSSVDNLVSQLQSAASRGQALSEVHEAMELFGSLVQKDPTLLELYMETLQLNMDIATEATMEIQSLERSREVIQYSRALVKQFPDQHIFLIHLIRDHANLLEDFDQLAEASTAIEEALSWFDTHPLQDPESLELHIDALLISGRLLFDQGHLDKALSNYDKTIKVVQPFADAYSEVASNIVWAKGQTLMAFCFIGQVPLALANIEDCLMFATDHDLEEEDVYTCYLENVSIVYRSSGDIDRAVSNMRRSIDIDRGHNKTPFSWILSDLLADAGEEEEALIVANEAIKECKEWKDHSKTLWRECYAQAQYTLSVRLFANNDLVQTRELLLEVRSFYRQHSQTRNVWFIKLTITLWALGHLECASGRHEEGIAARAELTELRKRLRLIFPRLDEFVEVGLKRERNFAAWKNLLKKINLKCRHQDEDDIPESAVISPSANIESC